MPDESEIIPASGLPEELSPTEKRRANMAKARAARTARRAAPTAAVGSAEFNAAVEQAAAAAVAKIVAELTAARGDQPAQPAVAAGDMGWARSLAMAMAEIADQGTGRTAERISPEIMAQRKAAAARMQRLLVKARARGDRPVYQLKNKIQMRIGDRGEAVIDPIWMGNDKIHYPTEIECNDAPNLAMIPMNDVAKEIYAAFAESIGNLKVEKEVEEIALTAGGVVVRGGAAAALFRATGRAPEMARPGGAAMEGATIRRHQPSQTKDVRVLGTIQPPARQNA